MAEVKAPKPLKQGEIGDIQIAMEKLSELACNRDLAVPVATLKLDTGRVVSLKSDKYGNVQLVAW